MPGEMYLKYGGVRFINNVPPREINRFVRELPDEKRSSMYEIAKELCDHGLITIYEGQFSTADDETETFQK